MRKLEICCYSAECAKKAQQAGADRVELCASQADGGITPGYGMLKQTREQVTIPVHPIIRPRGGDFCYSPSELAEMKDDIVMIREMGFPGIVLGVLDEEGVIDHKAMQQLLSVSGELSVTFHRAFDMCVDPLVALQTLTEMGIDRILTSGQQQSAEKGLSLLRQLIEISQGPIIMPGGGIRPANLQRLIDIGAQEIHTSAGRRMPSRMRYRKAGVGMSTGNEEYDEYSYYAVDSDEVAAIKAILTSAGQ
ncbi:MAG: copper homeostasis protein CutC [Enterobacteriaceae bacterium]